MPVRGIHAPLDEGDESQKSAGQHETASVFPESHEGGLEASSAGVVIDVGVSVVIHIFAKCDGSNYLHFDCYLDNVPL